MNDIYKTYPHNPPHYFVSNAIYMVTGSTLSQKHLLPEDEHKSVVLEVLFERAHHWGWNLEGWAILEITTTSLPVLLKMHLRWQS